MKKAISLILSVVMLFSITAGIDLSALAQVNPTVFSEIDMEKEVNAGETIRVPVSIKNNTGNWRYNEIIIFEV